MDMNLNKLREIVKDREACSPWGHNESDTDSVDMNLNKLQEIVKDREGCSSWGHNESDTT